MEREGRDENGGRESKGEIAEWRAAKLSPPDECQPSKGKQGSARYPRVNL